MTVAPELLLASHLKTLRLPTFLREHDKLARICAAEGLDHVRYLARLTELELIDRERRMVERRIKSAKFPAVKSLPSRGLHANHCRATDQLRLQGHPVVEQNDGLGSGAVRLDRTAGECHRAWSIRS